MRGNSARRCGTTRPGRGPFAFPGAERPPCRAAQGHQMRSLETWRACVSASATHTAPCGAWRIFTVQKPGHARNFVVKRVTAALYPFFCSVIANLHCVARAAHAHRWLCSCVRRFESRADRPILRRLRHSAARTRRSRGACSCTLVRCAQQLLFVIGRRPTPGWRRWAAWVSQRLTRDNAPCQARTLLTVTVSTACARDALGPSRLLWP